MFLVLKQQAQYRSQVQALAQTNSQNNPELSRPGLEPRVVKKKYTGLFLVPHTCVSEVFLPLNQSLSTPKIYFKKQILFLALFKQMWPFYISRVGTHGIPKKPSIGHMHGIHTLSASIFLMRHAKIFGGFSKNAFMQVTARLNSEIMQSTQFTEIIQKIFSYAKDCSSLTCLNCFSCFIVGNHLRLPELQVKTIQIIKMEFDYQVV